MAEPKKYGLAQLPPLFTRPLWRDRFIWLIVFTVALWASAIGYFLL